MKIKQNLNLLISLLVISILSIIMGLHLTLAFNLKCYIGISLLLICFITYFTYLKIFKYTFGTLLIISTFNVVQLTPFLVGLTIFHIDTQIIPLLFLFFFLYVNRSRVLDLIQNANTKSVEEESIESKSRFEKFKSDFKDLSDIEIENRLKYNLTPEAKKALLEIKSEKSIS